ncbi:heavy metal-binding domain-containing protein [Hymenobacter rubripertinctus]|uniref:Heavy metal binding domain-containing protein n=1 Tax=Hymenobacter rubripertinctus TaxID=2029981 RepID=A0A418R2I5_9BACT|nr:heavy metal-binding domain-containing protein [Hymenobacter rubripertinctus]RIY11608.1 hypothetical protein D0T11_07300 [Hymenobacter rubripertinctus]
MLSLSNQTLLALALPGLVLLASCEAKPAATAAVAVPAAAPADSTALPVATAAYVCPMNCAGSASDQPGKCPICEMELEPNPAAESASAL